MSEQILTAPKGEPAPPPKPGRPEQRTLGSLARQHPWVLVGVALVLFSTALVVWARTRPGYDPYGWLVWGYQTLHLSLDLGGAPSWKPLPYLFTVPYALFGHYELWLWMITAVTISMTAPIFAGRIVYRLIATAPERRRAAVVSAVFAGLTVFGIDTFVHTMLSAQSDTMITALWLGAVDMHLSGRPRWAFALALLASLGRPEGWPILGLYAIWAWRRRPDMRWFVGIGFGILVFMWFGIPTITNMRPLIASELAERSVRELHENKIVGTFHRWTALTYLPIQLAALGATIVAFFRRDRRVLALAAGAVIWMLVEIAFSLHGYPGAPRYMFEAAAMLGVLAGIAVGWILLEAPRLRQGLPRWVGIPLAGLLVISLVPGAASRLRFERKDLRHERGRTKVINWLSAAVNHLGGAEHITKCGRPVTNVEYVSILAWYTHRNVGTLGYRPLYEKRLAHPIVLFTELPNGWEALPWHTPAALGSSCTNLKAAWIYTRHHPGGVLVPRR